MEIKNTFIEGNLDISVESTSLKEEGEPLYNLLINGDCYTFPFVFYKTSQILGKAAQDLSVPLSKTHLIPHIF